MRGVIILSEGRSGTNWLGSLANSTGQLGRSSEWIDDKHFDVLGRNVSSKKYIEFIMESSSTANGFFAIKMFPRHLFWFQKHFGFDFIKKLEKENDLSFIFVTRNDRIRQAVSFARAVQSNAWTSLGELQRAEEYDFDLLCRCYFGIGRSYDYWKSYIDLHDLPHKHFVYEDMLSDPSPYVDAIAEHAGLEGIAFESSPLKIQRDSTTEEWCERFLRDVRHKEIIEQSGACTRPSRKLSNFIRFLRGKPLEQASYTIR